VDTPVDIAVENPVDNYGDIEPLVVLVDSILPGSNRWFAPLHAAPTLNGERSVSRETPRNYSQGGDSGICVAILRKIKQIWFIPTASE
jgi:hypothetical protein